MLDSLTKFFSIATIAALYLIALFNIGYFYVIGYHFIGVSDLDTLRKRVASFKEAQQRFHREREEYSATTMPKTAPLGGIRPNRARY